MQFQLQFRVQTLTLPLAYQYPVQSMIYRILKQNREYGKDIHDKGIFFGQKEFRPFCLSWLSGKCHVNTAQKQITFFETVRLELRTYDEKLAAVLHRLFIPGLQLELYHQPLILEAVEHTTFQVSDSSCMIDMISPVMAYETVGHDTNYFTPLQPEFISRVEQNFMAKYQAFYGTIPEPIRFIPYAVGLQDKRVTRYKNNYLITAWNGKYKLIGKPEYLTFLYDAGLGPKNASGFGMFRIL